MADGRVAGVLWHTAGPAWTDWRVRRPHVHHRESAAAIGDPRDCDESDDMMRILFLASLLILTTSGPEYQGPYDVVIRNGRVLDGTGAPWFRAHVAIKGDMIVRIARRITEPATQVLDAGGAHAPQGCRDTRAHARRGLA